MAWQVFHFALTITAFVAVMMLLVEYANVRTKGVVLRAMRGSAARQYLLAVALGATPGCLGAYVLVALYIHRQITLGAVVAGMIATSGDEMFVMLAVVPRTAVFLTGGLVILGVAAGWATDRLARHRAGERPDSGECCSLEVHEADACRCYPSGDILSQWRPPSAPRAILAVGLACLCLALIGGHLGPAGWDWKRVTLLAVMAAGLFVVATVPDHFLDEHLWRHVALQHVPRIFLWTFGVLGVIAIAGRYVDVTAVATDNRWAVLAVAGLVGMLPESGPHLVFVTLYAEGAIPLSVLFASSAVQDGHGMLPLLAHSGRAFLWVKLINLVVGLAAGAALMAVGW